jgi:hypothetical protein
MDSGGCCSKRPGEGIIGLQVAMMTKLPHDSADAAALTQLQVGSVFGDLPDILMEKMMTT